MTEDNQKDEVPAASVLRAVLSKDPITLEDIQYVREIALRIQEETQAKDDQLIEAALLAFSPTAIDRHILYKNTEKLTQSVISHMNAIESDHSNPFRLHEPLQKAKPLFDQIKEKLIPVVNYLKCRIKL